MAVFLPSLSLPALPLPALSRPALPLPPIHLPLSVPAPFLFPAPPFISPRRRCTLPAQRRCSLPVQRLPSPSVQRLPNPSVYLNAISFHTVSFHAPPSPLSYQHISFPPVPLFILFFSLFLPPILFSVSSSFNRVPATPLCFISRLEISLKIIVFV